MAEQSTENTHAELVAALIDGMPCQHDHGGQSSHEICKRATRQSAEALATRLLRIPPGDR